MNFRKLLTYLTMGTAAAMPIATAQNPTILQGSYVSNVFGPSNYVLNPNAQTNIANVTVSSATVARSTTTPLVATSEFTITTSTSTGYADWALRTFDSGMKNNNCEARFTYRGFTVGSTKAQILQGTNVVAELTLVGDANNPKIASINFPCGDLSAVTKFRLQQATASLTGTNEIGGIYVGLATNQANVAQAEFVGSLTWPIGYADNSNTANAWTAFGNVGTTNPTIVGSVNYSAQAPKITINNLKAGNYRIIYAGSFACFSTTNADAPCSFRITDGTTQFGSAIQVRSYGAISTVQGMWVPVLTFDFQYTGATTTKTFQLEGHSNSATNTVRVETGSTSQMQITAYRFPLSSELVVTPERQNVFGGVSYAGSSDFSGTSATVASVTDSNFGARTFYGGASLAGTACGLTANDFGFCMTNVPPGTYQITGNAEVGVIEAGTDKSFCNYKVRVGGTTLSDTEVINAIPHSNSWNAFTPIGTGIIKITAFQPNLRIWMSYSKDTLADSCSVRSTINATLSALPSLQISPLDQPSNSALYVQGPVLGAQTGAAIPAGYVGELKEAQASTINVTTSPTTITSLSLTPGVWLVNFNAQADTTSAAFECGVATATNSSTGWDVRKNYAVQIGGASSYPYAILSNYYLAVTATTTYYLTCKVSAGTINSSGRFHAVRLN